MLCAAPVASYEVVWNGAASGGAMVTITGLNFGSYGFTATANVAFDADCGTTSWSSDTTVACTLSAATTLITSYSKVTVGAVVGTRATKAFTFDGVRMGMGLGRLAGALWLRALLLCLNVCDWGMCFEIGETGVAR